MNFKNPKRPEYKLNEPSPKIRGGPTRQSTRLPRARPAAIARRERLNELLRAHDPETARRSLAKITSTDDELLRQIAREGVASGVSPSLRQNAITALGQHPTPKNLDLLAELATHGEDVYVRSHALIALGNCGLALVAPLLRDALTATDPMEAAAAERGLESLARTVGAEMLATVFADEKRRSVLAQKENIYRRLKDRESQTRKPRATGRLTSSRPKRRT